MNINIDENGIKKIIEHYGVSKQLCVHMEECAELIQAVSKVVRDADDKDTWLARREHLMEEIADVIVCIIQMQKMFDIKDADINDYVDYKVDRQLRRIENENKRYND